jgi:hypothetical protein
MVMLPPWGSVGWFIVAPSGQILKPCLWQALCALAVAAAIAPPCELMLEAALALIAASTERRETIATAASIMVGGIAGIGGGRSLRSWYEAIGTVWEGAARWNPRADLRR